MPRITGDRVAAWERMEKVLHWYHSYIDKHGHAPTQIEVAKKFNLTRQRVAQIVGELMRGGDIPICTICKQKRRTLTPITRNVEEKQSQPSKKKINSEK